MSKVVAGAAAVVLGGGTATAGGIYLPPLIRRAEAFLPQKLQEFKDGGQNLGCVRSLFGGLETVKVTGSSGTSVTDLDANFFGTETSNTTTGCLVVNWDKENYGESKWKGTFRFLWAVKGQNGKGFLAFVLGTASNDNTNKEIKWEGSFHTLERAGTEPNRKWSIQKEQPVPAGSSGAKSFKKESGGSDTNNKFPAPGPDLGVKDNPTFWGFFSEVGNLDNICGSSECAAEALLNRDSFRGHWIWSEKHGDTATGEQKKLSSWTQNLETWWKEVFGENPKVKDLAEKQVGVWIRRV